jgi:hypothetical protein
VVGSYTCSYTELEFGRFLHQVGSQVSGMEWGGNEDFSLRSA